MALPLPQPDPGRALEARRLANAFDLVPSVLAAAVGLPWDALTPNGIGIWSFQGGQMSLTWADDQSIYHGGTETAEEVGFGGTLRMILRPLGQYDDLSLRRAAVVLGLRALRDGGSALAASQCYLTLDTVRHIAPTDDDDGSVYIETRFSLRVVLQVLDPPDDVETV